MSETGKEYALKNRFSATKIEEALIFGREHHKNKQFIEDWVVERACDKERKQGALEELKQVVDAINPREYAEELIKELEGAKEQ